jgi:hypothetical protein
MTHRTPYTARITALAPGYEPHHVEAYMRLGHSTLDHLSEQEFRAEIGIAKACIDEAGVAAAERLAASFGLQANGGK